MGTTGLNLKAPTISVIIPHYNDLDNLRICLRCLSEQTLRRDQFEIIVSDNNSECGLEAVKSACEGIAAVCHAPLQGAGPARDVAVQYSSAPFLAFIDSDCRPSREWLAVGLEALLESEMVGGEVQVCVVDPERPTPTEAFELVFAFDNKRYIEKRDFSVTANLFVRRSVFETVGGFRPYIHEDIDWGRRAVALGYRWRYEPKARIVHPARHDWDDLSQKWRRLIKGSVFEARHQHFGISTLIFYTFALLVSPIFQTPKILSSKKLTSIKQKLDAIKILYILKGWRFIETYRELLRQQDR